MSAATLSPTGGDARLRIAVDDVTVIELDAHAALCVDQTTADLTDKRLETSGDTVTIVGAAGTSGLEATWTARELGHDGGVWELGLVLRNAGDRMHALSRMDPFAARLAGDDWHVSWFRSSWGAEFAPESGPLGQQLSLGSRSGRSSHGMHPWLGLQRPGAALVVAPAWSGNWHIDVDDSVLTAGISSWRFETNLSPGAELTAPSVVIAASDTIENASVALAGAVGHDWIPRSAASNAMPTEWNHWWPYEDVDVSEDVILSNAGYARRVGIEVATVDAGWFGAADAASDWQEQRGDWDQVNTVRFPGGLRALGDGIRARGPKVGMWVEAEAVGAAARIRATRPEIIAHGAFVLDDPSYTPNTVSLDDADPTFLGYVCMGAQAGRDFVARILDETVASTGAEWVKLDFNVDPGSGCTRTDHGHGGRDGLFRHYEGLYEVLDDFRARHPNVIVEACSSGGLRIDLGLARHVHCMFLSDPDYTEHHLQVLWGASLMLPPAAMLHWSWSQWRGDYPPAELDFNALTIDEFDTTLRAALLQRFGVSLRLPDLSADQLERLAWHVRLFTDMIAPFVRSGVLRRLTGQPLRAGQGERSPIFQLTDGGRHILAAFRLGSGAVLTTISAVGLVEGVRYRATDIATGEELEMDGATIVVNRDLETPISSWLVLIEPAVARNTDERSKAL